MTVKSNKSKRTFTIRKESIKYRTLPFTKGEFNDMEMNTTNDWKNFLRSSASYYVVK